MRFTTNSFTEEITNKAEAKAVYTYFMQNSLQFIGELDSNEVPYDEKLLIVKTLWQNLIASCDRVGYTNRHIEDVKKQLASTQPL